MQEKKQPNQLMKKLSVIGKMLCLILAVGISSIPSNFALARDNYKLNFLEIKITGIVADENNHPIQGATVTIKGTKKGVATDANGRFTLVATQGNLLIVSSLGFLTQEITVSQNEMNIKLKEDVKQLEEVTIGYQRLRKSDLTGSISSVKASELNLIIH